jgi:hypothetical protein
MCLECGRPHPVTTAMLDEASYQIALSVLESGSTLLAAITAAFPGFASCTLARLHEVHSGELTEAHSETHLR